MIYNYIKCESVIAKIMSDLDSTEVNQRISDIKEWIFEAVEKIGAPMQYMKKESGHDGVPILHIQDKQVPMPSDLVQLDGVAYSKTKEGTYKPMMVSTAVFHKNIPPKRFKDYQKLDKFITSQSQLYTHARKEQEFEEIPEYFIKPGWIVTNKQDGYIKIAYKSIATDERGYPLIPDLESYKEAIYWYVVMKLNFPKYLSGNLGGKGVKQPQNVYFYIQQQWNFYRNQAYAEAMMPTADNLENIKRDWHKLIPEYDANETFFRDINKEQSVINDYYNGY